MSRLASGKLCLLGMLLLCWEHWEAVRAHARVIFPFRDLVPLQMEVYDCQERPEIAFKSLPANASSCVSPGIAHGRGRAAGLREVVEGMKKWCPLVLSPSHQSTRDERSHPQNADMLR